MPSNGALETTTKLIHVQTLLIDIPAIHFKMKPFYCGTLWTPANSLYGTFTHRDSNCSGGSWGGGGFQTVTTKTSLISQGLRWYT